MQAGPDSTWKQHGLAMVQKRVPKSCCLKSMRGGQTELWPDHFIMYFIFQTQPHVYLAFQRKALCIQAQLDIIGTNTLLL